MILVLASENDETAEHFVAHAESVGQPCLLAHGLHGLSMSVTADRGCTTTVEVRATTGAAPITGVLNRGLTMPRDANEETHFQASEVLASFWSAIALLRCPVVNRPSRRAFLPALDLVQVASMAENVILGSSLISTRPQKPHSVLPTNIHSLADRRYQGRVGPFDRGAGSEREVCVFTTFDPSRTVHVLLAGDALFDLSQPEGLVAPDFRAALRPLVNELRRQGATFSLAVVEISGPDLTLVHASAFPTRAQYDHVGPLVHQALLDYLR